MAGRPPAGATFEVERVGRKRSHGSLAALAWAGGLAALVGVAIVGRVGGSASAAPTAVPLVSAVPTDSITDLARLAPAPGDPYFTRAQAAIAEPFDLQSPPIGPMTLVTAQLTVIGTVQVRADRVQVALQTRNNRTVEQHVVDVSDAWAGIRPDTAPQFRVQFDIQAPRRLGTMWIVVTAFDANGISVARERRAFTVGPIEGG